MSRQAKKLRKVNTTMTRLHIHRERHLVSRIGWLRAAVLGANDGIVSTASLIIGVAAAAAKPSDILTAGAAGLVAGAMSMAAGEYVSVSSQSDTEQADLSRERGELAGDVDAELKELAGIYLKRGVDPATAALVARQLMAKDALAAHAHDELGISQLTTARPIQAALTSAATFTAGAALPLAMVFIVPGQWLLLTEAIGSLLFLALLGGIGARAGGAPAWTATLRVTVWGALAMALTAGIGMIVGTAV
jgi:VIT1/CCC1 family predicted Fe2+/Mn2+ transporter